MTYYDRYFDLKSSFKPNLEKYALSESEITCYTFRYNSAFSNISHPLDTNFEREVNCLSSIPDEDIQENSSFNYYIFAPGEKKRFNKAILLLHGLNERHWEKYLVWAFELAERTGHPVILFPIAFHMNRSPAKWANPRSMQTILEKRKAVVGNDPALTFANVALSCRLTDNPLRFFTSGQQSAYDIIQLQNQIQSGNHPLFEKSATTHVFAYSIGAFLAQIMFLSNPGNIFTQSRLFLFCGGAFFNAMNGVSRLIMDKTAFQRLLDYYIREINQSLQSSCDILDRIKSTLMGNAFLSMLAPEIMPEFRTERLQKMGSQIQVVTLLQDTVIPASGASLCLGQYSDNEILDFDFPYTHEVPFPINYSDRISRVNEAFDKIMGKAASFLK